MFNVIIVEKKKASTSRSAHPTPGSWTHAEGQLLGYMLSRRDNQEKDLRRLFGIVGIGRYVRFYQLIRGKTELEDYKDGATYHLDNDGLAIERTILAIKSYIDRYR